MHLLIRSEHLKQKQLLQSISIFYKNNFVALLFCSIFSFDQLPSSMISSEDYFCLYCNTFCSLMPGNRKKFQMLQMFGKIIAATHIYWIVV